ncbi:TLR4 interactor with leucine rich repeats-like [Centruroides sculpturatus]|uniref:TLR4 interactor with leucine rich repeats-like n=1 Tax=Centruroides sculpturatus TaxID=218467 RepID=UPI000C6CFB7E|nr:TLR4 interactor with leucine rich repeats-like [Centruroides sculpturatus]
MDRKYIFLAILSLLNASDSRKCPDDCRCYENLERKYTVCELGGLKQIPTTDMESDTQVLIISAPRDKPNYLTIGRIFLKFSDLREIRIVQSNLPAIGDSSFWPGDKLLLLDLSHNNITILRDTDFNGLENLRVLNLSYNHISGIPSAPFRLLKSLKTLSLGNNRLRGLVPRSFYLLPELEVLDLGGNPLKDIDPEYMKDVKPLRKLVLAGCQLTRLHSLIYQQLPNLEELDLRNNKFKFFSPEEFRYLKRLRVLRLDGNSLTVIVDKTFDGHNLDHLGLSGNRIHRITPCTFCNTSIKELDLSNNSLISLNADVLAPLVPSLSSLNISHNPLNPRVITAVLKLLYRLEKLNIAGMGLTQLSDDTLSKNRNLRHLNASQNKFSNVSYKLLAPLKALQLLDLSKNNLRWLYPKLLEQLSNATDLSVLHLENNPWLCQECHIVPLLTWNSTLNRCEFGQECLRCAQPPSLADRILQTLQMEELQPCAVSLTQPIVLPATSNIGVVVAVTIIIILLLIAVIAVVLYRQQGAVYYTHEEERNHDYSFDPCFNRNGGDKRLAFINMDRIEEAPEDRQIRSNVR